MAADLSLQHHSIRFYTGTYRTTSERYQYGNDVTSLVCRKERFYDTWDDFHLIPTERPTVAIPSASTKLITIPGKSTPLDLTNFLTGHPTYANRSGSWTFYTDPDYINETYGSPTTPGNYLYAWRLFEERLRELFHGHVSKIALRDDPSYFYVGELTLNPLQTGADRSSITISYNLYPFKKSMMSSLEMWQWDEFDFRDGTIMYMKDLQVNGSRIVRVYGSTERISPRIVGSTGIICEKLEGGSWREYGLISDAASTSAKAAILPRLIIEEGENQLRFRGNGTVTIDYRRGLL